jgi:phage tail-like protein
MAEAKAPEAPPPEGDPGAMPGVLEDPFRAYNFKLLIDGVNEGHFIQCSGMKASLEVIHYREAGGGAVVRKLAGPLRLGEVTLRYGLTRSPELWNWFQGSMSGTPQRKNVSILMMGMDGVTEVLRWNLLEAWPFEWHGAPLDALGQMVAIESLVLTFESFNRG